MSDLVKKDPTSIDNFAGWEDGVEGDDRPQGAGIVQGTLAKFSNEAAWITRDGDELPADLELVAVDVARVVQRWQDQAPAETIVLEPHQKFPDIEEMNQKVPRKEWVEGPDGQPRGPWQAQHILYLLDPKTMDKYTFATGTTGGKIAIRELRDKLVWMRRLRGPNVYPVITLADKFMNTRFGGRQRPHFVIKRWVSLGAEGGQVEALPSPSPPPKPADESVPQTTSDLPLKEIKEPSLAEEMEDEIPDFENENAESSKVAAPPLPNPRRNPKKPAKPSAKKPSPKRNVLDAG
jgi:hypothetical protein